MSCCLDIILHAIRLNTDLNVLVFRFFLKLWGLSIILATMLFSPCRTNHFTIIKFSNFVKNVSRRQLDMGKQTTFVKMDVFHRGKSQRQVINQGILFSLRLKPANNCFWRA